MQQGLMATPGEYVCFRLGAEEYGVGILKVQEIRQYEKPTRVPTAPAHFKGFLNLRGSVIPVIDLRVKFGLPVGRDEDSMLVILTLQDKVLGVTVDSVTDVLNLVDTELRACPLGVASSSVIGLGDKEGRMVILVDPEKALALDVPPA